VKQQLVAIPRPGGEGVGGRGLNAYAGSLGNFPGSRGLWHRVTGKLAVHRAGATIGREMTGRERGVFVGCEGE
jgi:hypothetical protein